VTRASDPTAAFAAAGVVAAAAACVVTFALSATGSSAGDAPSAGRGPAEGAAAVDDGAVADPGADASAVARSASAAMRTVTSVEFRLRREGAPVHIDELGRIALDGVRGRFTVPARAQAELEVTVAGDVTTRLGAIAIDDEVWISNPVTGEFDGLADGYDVDPSRFFDPEGAWAPLLADLGDVTLVGVDDRGGDRYHLRGTAPAARVTDITAGLVRDQDVVIDLWIHPSSFLVTAAELETRVGDAATRWELELGRYGEVFDIRPPSGVGSGSGGG